MKIICSFCRADLGEKEPFDVDSVTHGMCDACADHFGRQWAGLDLGEYLDRFDRPVLAVSQDGRIVAANQLMADMLGKSERRLFGLLGGEAMECRFARLPEGCGNTIHCKTCTVRNTVMGVLETGEPREGVSAYVDQGDRRVGLTISAYKRDRFVLLVVDESR
jgi:PAS domain-containing protein